METLGFLSLGLEVALQPTNLMVALLGAFIGTIVGLLPGLGPVNGVALLMPFTYAIGLPAETALILLVAVYVGCEYGGRISAILMNIPGDAAALMTTLDGYPMAKQGKAGIALSISAVSSFFGSLLATIGVVLFAPLLAKWATSFGPAEYFALMIFAITCLTGLVTDKPIKTLIAALIGIALSIPGVDGVSGVYRYTFDIVGLFDGIQFTTIIIGFFSISEILLMLEQAAAGTKIAARGQRMYFNVKEFLIAFPVMIRSGIVGFVVGVLPGAGATIASAITYTSEKKLAGNKGDFGNGDIRGVAAPEAANNASANGSLIPMLTLGIPGSGTTAVMIGALTLYNITPGPQLFSQEPQLVWGLIVSLFICNIILLIMNLPLVGFFAKLLSVPNYILVPGIALVSFTGVYALYSTTFDLFLVILFGVFGYFLRKFNYPLSALILGYVLGDMMEANLRRALSISNGEVGILWNSSISITLWVLSFFVILLPIYRAYKRYLMKKVSAKG